MATDDDNTKPLQAGYDVADRIKSVRKNAGLTQQAFAQRINVSRSYLSEVENLKGKPTIEMIVGVANEFSHISLRWLLTGQQPMENYDLDLMPHIEPIDGGALYHALSEATRIKEKYNLRLDHSTLVQFVAMLYNAYAAKYNEARTYGLKDKQGNSGEFVYRNAAASSLHAVSKRFDLGSIFNPFDPSDEGPQ